MADAARKLLKQKRQQRIKLSKSIANSVSAKASPAKQQEKKVTFAVAATAAKPNHSGLTASSESLASQSDLQHVDSVSKDEKDSLEADLDSTDAQTEVGKDSNEKTATALTQNDSVLDAEMAEFQRFLGQADNQQLNSEAVTAQLVFTKEGRKNEPEGQELDSDAESLDDTEYEQAGLDRRVLILRERFTRKRKSEDPKTSNEKHTFFSRKRGALISSLNSSISAVGDARVDAEDESESEDDSWRKRKA